MKIAGRGTQKTTEAKWKAADAAVKKFPRKGTGERTYTGERSALEHNLDTEAI